MDESGDGSQRGQSLRHAAVTEVYSCEHITGNHQCSSIQNQQRGLNVSIFPT